MRLRPVSLTAGSARSLEHTLSVVVPLVAAALLALGGLADRMTDTAPTVRKSPVATTTNTDLVALAHDIGGDSHYALYFAVREHSHGARLVLDDQLRTGVLGESPGVLVHEPYLHALAGASEIRRQRLETPVEFNAHPTATGSFLGQRWQLVVGPDVSTDTVLVVWEASGVHWIVNERLLDVEHPSLGGALPGRALSGESMRPVVSPAAADAVLLAILLLAGGLLLPSSGFPTLIRLVLALIVGVALQATVGMLLLPGVLSVGVTLAVAVTLGGLLNRAERPIGWKRSDVPCLVAAGAVLTLVAVTARAARLVWVSPDSVNYLAQARMLADGALSPALLEVKRGIGQQALHAPGFALGAEGFHSLGPAILVAAVLLVASLPSLFHGGQRRAMWTLSLLLAGALVTAPAIPIMATYVNSHLLVAILLLVLAVLLGLGVQGGWPLAATPVVTALVVLRPEGAILAGIMLLGSDVASGRTSHRIWYALGASTLVWNLLLTYGAVQRGIAPSAPIIAMGALGAMTLLVPSVLSLLAEPWRRRIPSVLAGALWLVALGVIAIGGDRVGYVRAVVANLGQGLGRWGSFGIAMILVAMIVLAAKRAEDSGPGPLAARLVLVSFVPLTILTKLADGLELPGSGAATLLSGGGRVGWGDSVNRMWLHAMLLVLLLLFVHIAERSVEISGKSSAAADA